MGIVLNNNQYYTGLTNLAIYITMYKTNSNDATKRTIDSFTTESLSYGDSKIFRSLPFPQVSDYSKTSSLLSDNTPSFVPKGTETSVNVVEEQISVNNKKLIKSTYSLKNLELAVTSSDGASEFIAIVMSNIESAKNDFLYDLIINKLYNANYGKSVDIEILDETKFKTTPTELDACNTINNKRIALAIQNEIDGLTHFSTDYNKYGLKQAVNLSDLRLVIFQPYKNKAVTDLFAELLNSKYISENFPRPELITIPLEKAKKCVNYNANTVGTLMHKSTIQLFFKLVFMGDFFDPSTLRVNNFLHFWFALGQVEQLPSCKFSTVVKGA